MAGVLTAAASIAATRAPAVAAAPSPETSHTTVNAGMAEAADGTYEACSAYFGFGKQSDGVLDVVQFDVADQNPTDGIHHAVPSDTQVVLVLENSAGDTLKCIPQEVTKAQWDAAMADLQIDMPAGKSFPAWPGPGHYAYPSIPYGPHIDGFGDVVDAGFQVTSEPAGHTLVSPTGVKHLTQHYLAGFVPESFVVDPRVLDLIQREAGAAAKQAFEAALPACENGDDVPSADRKAAVDALVTWRGYDTSDSYTCDDVGSLNMQVSFLLGLAQTTTYTEPIVLSLPESATTTTTTTTSTVPGAPATTATTAPVAGAPAAQAATPVPGAPRFTG